MMCPNCGKDMKDVQPGQAPGRVYGVDDNFYTKFIRRGRTCPHCHFVAETIEKPTGQSYFKREVQPPRFKNRGKSKSRRKRANQEA